MIQNKHRQCCFARHPNSWHRITFLTRRIILLTILIDCGGSWIFFSSQRFRQQQRSKYFLSQHPTHSDSANSNDKSQEEITLPARAESQSFDGKISENNREQSLVDVAARITKDAFHLLGIKSLGVDYGLVRTGLAVTVGFEPKPLAILSALNNTQVCEKIVDYARLEQVQRIIVGLPLHKNGTVAEQTNLTITFGLELMQYALRSLGPNVPVYFFDERYTSKEAAARARTRNPRSLSSSPADLYGMLDADAACIILENYYQDNGLGAHEYQLPKDQYQDCLKEFQQRDLQQQMHLQNLQKERERRLQNRRMAIASALETNQKAETLGKEENKLIAKRKKKKKKR